MASKQIISNQWDRRTGGSKDIVIKFPYNFGLRADKI